MVCALVCIVSGRSMGLGYDIGYRRGVLFTHFKDSVCYMRWAFPCMSYCSHQHLKLTKYMLDPKDTSTGSYHCYCNLSVFLIGVDQRYKPFLKGFGLNHRNVI